MRSGLDTGFLLDELWHLLKGEMDGSKRPALIELAKTLEGARVAYAIIGGVALQVHAREPRTTLYIDVAVLRRDEIPRDRLRAAGFERTGEFEHSENWVGPGAVPIQFTDDLALASAVRSAESIEVGGTSIRVIRKPDLLREKLRAGSDPARRRSKRMQDLADVQALIESDATLRAALTPEQRALLDRIV